MKKHLRSFHAFLTILQQIVHMHAMRSYDVMAVCFKCLSTENDDTDCTGFWLFFATTNPKSNPNSTRAIMTPIVLNFSYFNCNLMHYKP